MKQKDYIRLNVNCENFINMVEKLITYKNKRKLIYVSVKGLLINKYTFLALYLKEKHIETGKNIIIKGTIMIIFNKISYMMCTLSYGTDDFMCKGLRKLKGEKLKKQTDKKKVVGIISKFLNIYPIQRKDYFIPENGTCFSDCLNHISDNENYEKEKINKIIKYISKKSIIINQENVVSLIKKFKLNINLLQVSFDSDNSINYIIRNKCQYTLVLFEFEDYYHCVFSRYKGNKYINNIIRKIHDNIYFNQYSYSILNKNVNVYNKNNPKKFT